MMTKRLWSAAPGGGEWMVFMYLRRELKGLHAHRKAGSVSHRWSYG
jgi:hypothetical protein